ncbi:MAG TPA: chemotaxis protein CheW [Thermoanaerobaculia bacterium]|jgi:purine-binding chemotaxis protein CheW|nr:chemotaxis protein CheW [Thermoanaerobaculia bacterium]
MRQPDEAAGRELAAAAAAPAPAAGLLRLRFGGLPWAVAGDAVREVVGTERLQRNPRPAAGSPYGWLLGEREEVPVYLPGECGPGDPGNPGNASAAAVVVLQPAAGPRCGLAVEAVDEVRQEAISRLRLLPEPAASRRWAFPRVVLWDDGLALEIAPEAVPHLAASADPAGAFGEAARSAAAAVLTAGEARFDAGPWVRRAAASAGLFVFALPGGGAVDFALPAAQVVEVLPAVAPRPVPGAPAPLLGLLAWRGEALPVVDLALAIGLAPAPASPPGGRLDHAAHAAHAVVARAARCRQLLVFPVVRLAGVRQGPFPQPATATAPFHGARRVLGAFGDGERMLVVPDLDGALETFPVAQGAAGAASAWR